GSAELRYPSHGAAGRWGESPTSPTVTSPGCAAATSSGQAQPGRPCSRPSHIRRLTFQKRLRRISHPPCPQPLVQLALPRTKPMIFLSIAVEKPDVEQVDGLAAMPADLVVDVIANHVADLRLALTEIVAIPVQQLLALLDHDHLLDRFLFTYLPQQPPQPQATNHHLTLCLLNTWPLCQHLAGRQGHPCRSPFDPIALVGARRKRLARVGTELHVIEHRDHHVAVEDRHSLSWPLMEEGPSCWQ